MRKAPDDALLWPRHGPPAWVGDAVAALFIAAAAFAPIPDRVAHPQNPVQYVLALAPIVVLPLRRRWSLPVLGACVALYVGAVASGFTSPGITLAILVAMFGVANRMPRRTALIALGVVIVVTGVAIMIVAGDVFEPRIFPLAVTIALAGAAGDATRSRREYVEAVTERAIRAEETREAEARRRVSEERLRIARDLHDTVAHQISVISLNAGVASASLEARPEKTREALATIRTASRTVLGEIGDLLAVLRADESAQASDPAPQPGLRQLDALVASFRESGLDVVTRVEGDLAQLPPATDAVAYRVVQEGLTNALKHGAERRAHVLVEVGTDAARIVVSNPVSASSAPSDGSGGFGLLGLRERVAAVRGSVEAGETAAGHRLEATLPVSHAVPSRFAPTSPSPVPTASSSPVAPPSPPTVSATAGSPPEAPPTPTGGAA